jgi:hypothetical protein
VNKELTGLKSHVNDIMIKYNSKDNILNLQQSLNSHVENLKLSINNMFNDNSTKTMIDKITSDLRTDIANVRVEMKSVTERLNMGNIAELVNTTIKSYFNELKVDLQNTNNMSKQIEGLNNEIRKIREEKMSDKSLLHLQSHIDNKLADVKETFNSAMNKTTSKGNIGEFKIYNVLLNNLRGYEINDTSKKGHSFDFQIDRFGFKIGIESKEYSTNINKRVLDVFINNVKTSDCDAFIIINHHHGFAHMKEDFVLEYKYDKPIIYISRFVNCPLIILAAVKLLETLYIIKAKQQEEKKESNIVALEFKNEQQKKLIDNLLK